MLYFAVLYSLVRLCTEARVFCEDSNSSPWTPFGYSCPVLCETVVNAVRRLRLMDYKKTVFQDLTVDTSDYANDLVYNVERSQNSLSPNFEISRKFNHKNSINDIKSKTIYDSRNTKKDYRNNENIYNLDRDNVKRIINKIASLIKMADANVHNNGSATRRSYFDKEFVNIMTNIINKYVMTSFRFTEEMTEVILEKLFNAKTDIQHNLYDVSKLLKYLRKTVQINHSHDEKYSITLRPTNCITISVPGCFCKRGFVERSGKCVKPSQCLTDAELLHYLDRISVL